MNSGNTSAELLENPFAQSRLNQASDFRPEWDVASLNATASTALRDRVSKIIGVRTADPTQQIPVLLSPSGYGKTHLLARLRQHLGGRAFFVFVTGMEDVRRPLHYIRRAAVEALFEAESEGTSHLEEAMCELFHESIVEFLKRHPSLEAKRRQGLLQQLQQGHSLVTKIAGAAKDINSFRRLAKSTAVAPSMEKIRGSVVKGLVMGWSDHAQLARQWLRGETLSEEDAEILGIEKESPSALEVLKGITAILQYRKPMVICLDQLESTLRDPDGPNQLTIQLMELLAEVPGQFVMLAALEGLWGEFLENGTRDAFVRRTERIFVTDFPTDVEAFELVARRLKSWSRQRLHPDELWPFDRKSFQEYVHQGVKPNALLKKCDALLGEWVKQNDDTKMIYLTERVTQLSPKELFLKEWGEELQQVKKDRRRSPANVDEGRFFQALKELFSLMKVAGGNLGGLSVESMKENVLPDAGKNPRYAMRLRLKRAQSTTASILVATTNLNGGGGVYFLLKELEKAAKPATAAILLHLRRDFKMGVEGNQIVEKLSAKLEICPVATVRDSFDRLECALSLLEEAQRGEMILGIAQTPTDPAPVISYEQCQQLILDTHVLGDLQLFSLFAKWVPAADENAGGKKRS